MTPATREGGRVPDEPTNSELARRLDAIQGLLQTLPQTMVGRAEYASDQRGVEHRFAELAADIEDVRHQHTEDTRALHERISNTTQNSVANRQHWQHLIYTGLMPTIVAIAGVIGALWLGSHGGGK
jgi:hypothetical protein